MWYNTTDKNIHIALRIFGPCVVKYVYECEPHLVCSKISIRMEISKIQSMCKAIRVE